MSVCVSGEHELNVLEQVSDVGNGKKLQEFLGMCNLSDYLDGKALFLAILSFSQHFKTNPCSQPSIP